jgi:hypothetical protein
VKHELEYRQTLLEMQWHLPRIVLTLKAHHEIIAIAHDDDSTTRVAFSPLMDPEVKRLMYIDVSQKQADS